MPQYFAALPTLTNGNQVAELCDSRGRRHVASVPVSASGEAAAQNVGDYETVAASQSDQILGPSGAVGDVLQRLIIVPATVAAGNVSIKDGNGSAISIFVTGTLPSLVPIVVELGLVAVNATSPGWKVTTGANVSVIGIGSFT